MVSGGGGHGGEDQRLRGLGEQLKTEARALEKEPGGPSSFPTYWLYLCDLSESLVSLRCSIFPSERALLHFTSSQCCGDLQSLKPFVNGNA